MPTATRSPLAQLLREKLGEDPFDVIDRDYPDKSYRTIAYELSRDADVEVSYETVRRWHKAAA